MSQDSRNQLSSSQGDYVVGRARPLPLCRWWLRVRPLRRGIQLDPGPNSSPAVEFYAPWWAWPLEWFYRLVCGPAILLKEEESHALPERP